MINLKDAIRYLLQTLAAISLAVCGYFIMSLIDEVKAKPNINDVELIVTKRLEPVKDKQQENRERLIKVEQAVIGIISINNKLDGMDEKLDKACEDIAAIKAKQ